MPVVTTDTVLARYDRLEFIESGFIFQADAGVPLLTNHATILVERRPDYPDQATFANGVAAASYYSGVFVNEDSGSLIVNSYNPDSYTAATGVRGAVDVLNHGLIHVYSDYRAVGVEGSDLYQTGRFLVNRGDIYVVGLAEAFGAIGDGDVDNSGVIEVVSFGPAIGIARQGDIINSGVVSARSLGGVVPSYGVLLNADPLGRPSSLVNDGLIAADIAIWSVGLILDTVGLPASRVFSQDRVINGGEIRGQVLLGAYDDELLNDGLIDGDVFMGSQDDVYSGSGYVTGSFDGEEGNDRIVAGAGDDRLLGGEGSDLLDGGSGDDFLDAGRGADVIRGGKGFDVASYEFATAAVVADLSTGVVDSDARDRLEGVEGLIGSIHDDRLTGSAAADMLEGGAGNDRLSGGDGDDRLIGDSGADLLTGGAGADAFLFSIGDGADSIVDFNAAAGDRLNIYGYSSAAGMHQLGADVRITLASGDRITLRNLTLAEIPAGAILFSSQPLPPEPAGAPLREPMHVSSSVFVSANETLAFTGGLGILMDSIGEGEQSLFNSGLITVEADEADAASQVFGAVAVLAHSDTNASPVIPSSIVNQLGAVIRITSDSTAVTGISTGGWAPAVYNYGRVEAETTRGAADR